MIMHTYPSFYTHLSKYRVGRLWLLSHGLFPALSSPCSLIPWTICQSNPFYEACLPVPHSRRPQQLSFDLTNVVFGIFLKMHKRHHTTYMLSEQRYCRITYLPQLQTFTVDKCSSIAQGDLHSCWWLHGWLHCRLRGSLKTHPCMVPVYSYKCSTRISQGIAKKLEV